MSDSSNEALTFEDLSTIYRVERKAPTLGNVRRDLYPAMATLMITLRGEYERQISVDPESLMCEGANQRRKRCVQLSKEIVQLRMQKICSMALRGAMGAQNVVTDLTSEEKEYYDEILNISRRQESILTRMGGEKKRYSSPDIDEPVAKPIDKPKDTPVKETIPTPVAEPMMEDMYDDYEGEEIIDDIPDDILDEMIASNPVIENKPVDKPKVVPVTDTEIVVEEGPEMSVSSDEMIVIRVLEDLPGFAGPDRDYILSKEDIVRMPKVMGMALINRDKAVEINPSQ